MAENYLRTRYASAPLRCEDGTTGSLKQLRMDKVFAKKQLTVNGRQTDETERGSG